MIAEEYDPKLVFALRELKKAFAVYDRAWFYFDPKQLTQLPTNKSLSYIVDVERVENILVNGIPGIPKTPKQLLYASLYVVSARTLETYEEAWTLLLSRNNWLISEYGKSRANAESQGIKINDRDLEFTHVTTKDLNQKVESLISHVSESQNIDASRDEWCAYEIEMDLLHGRCRLLIDEISHVVDRIDRLQDLTNSNVQISGANESLKWGVRGIYISVGIGLISAAIGVFSVGVAIFTYLFPMKEGAAVAVQGQSETANLLIANDLMSLKSEVETLRDKLNNLGMYTNDEATAISTAIKDFDNALISQASNASEQTKALKDLDITLNKFLVAQTNAPLASTNSHYDDTELRAEVKSVQDSINDLKKTIEQMKPTQIIIEDHSKSKRGFLNWF
jgi:hypothetical protein